MDSSLSFGEGCGEAFEHFVWLKSLALAETWAWFYTKSLDLSEKVLSIRY